LNFFGKYECRVLFKTPGFLFFYHELRNHVVSLLCLFVLRGPIEALHLVKDHISANFEDKHLSFDTCYFATTVLLMFLDKTMGIAPRRFQCLIFRYVVEGYFPKHNNFKNSIL
jgi:hypothetical protein